MPTLHPGFLIRGGWAWRGTVTRDLIKALQLAHRGTCAEELRVQEAGEVGKEQAAAADTQTRHCGDGDSIFAAIDGCKGAVVIDIECVRDTNRITQINFGWEGKAAIWRPKAAELQAHQELKRLLASGRLKIFHNAPFDIRVFEGNGLDVNGPFYDTMIAAAILEPDLPNDLEFVAKEYAEFEPWKHLAERDLARYGLLDAEATYRVYEVTREELRKEGVWGCFQTSMEVLPLLLDMRRIGLRIDEARMRKEAAACRDKEEAAERDLNRAVQELPSHKVAAEEIDRQLSAVWKAAEGTKGRESIRLRKESRQLIERLHEVVLPNWSSPKQVLKVLDDLGLQRKVKDGKVTTDASALQELARQTQNPLLQRLLDLRNAQKLRSTYFDHDLGDEPRIHPEYLLHRDYEVEGGIAGACSGRLASKNPNIQNRPKPARCIVVPDEPGWEAMAVDYEQIEFRIIAWKTGGKLWADVKTAGFDIHRRVAARVYGVSEEAVTEAQRDEGKRCVYAAAYGVGPLTLSRRLAAKGIFLSVAECKRFIGAFKGLYPEVARTQARWVDEAVATGKVTNPFGRYRRFYKPYEEATQIYNIFPQSTAGDIILRAMSRLYVELPKPARIAIQVHDELVFFYPRELRAAVAECVRDIMPAAVPEMPGFVVAVKLKIGKSWGELGEEGLER